MARARIQLEPGYVLNARAYGDTSLLLEIFTRAHGRVGLVAKGARGPKSRTRALLQPLQPLLLSWYESGELGTLTGAEAQAAPVTLVGERVFFAWYLNELLLHLLQRHDAHPSLFDCYATALSQLAGDEAEAALRVFEKHLLAETGYGLHLDTDLRADALYRYDDEVGAVPVNAGAEALLGASLMALRDETPFDARALGDTRKLLRPLLARQLGGKELETAKLLREMRRGPAAARTPGAEPGPE